MADVISINAGVGQDLLFSCEIAEGSTGPKPADPIEVDLIVQRLSFSGRPALDRANSAWNRLKAATKRAFAGDPQSSVVAFDVDGLNGVIEGAGRSLMLLESAGDIYAKCTTYEGMEAGRAALAQEQENYGRYFAEMTRIYTDLEAAFQATQKACKTVRVREEIPTKAMKKAGAPTTRSTGGATMTFPKTFDVGKKPRGLPVNITSPAGGRATVTIARRGKGIVGTGGWVAEGTFGLLMTVPGKTKTGKAVLTYTLDTGVTVKGTIRFT
jgi:hypothetical protein